MYLLVVMLLSVLLTVRHVDSLHYYKMLSSTPYRPHQILSLPLLWHHLAFLSDCLSFPYSPSIFYRSIGTTTKTRINLGLLSVKGDAPRTANIICVPEHEIWKMKTFEEVKAFLVKSFPQIDFATFVSDEEIRRFASTASGEFPKPQFVKKVQQIFKHKGGGKAETAG